MFVKGADSATFKAFKDTHFAIDKNHAYDFYHFIPGG